MNDEERHLISDLFERLRANGPVEKDQQAEQHIISLARNYPDAGYMLVQNILVQEQVIGQQQQEIDDLKNQLAQVQQARVGQPGRSGGFLGGGAAGGTGGMFGGNRGSVPQGQGVPNVSPMNHQAQPQYAPQYTPPPAAPSSPWGRPAQAQAPQAPAQPAPPASGGGFMRSALGMAAGVAGGMLAGQAISNMMRGNSSTPSGEQPASGDFGSNDQGNHDASGDNYGYGNGNESNGGDESYDNNDPGTNDAGGGDVGGFDGEDL